MDSQDGENEQTCPNKRRILTEGQKERKSQRDKQRREQAKENMSEEEKERKRQRERQRYELAKQDMSEAEKQRKRQRERELYELAKQDISEAKKVKKRQRDKQRWEEAKENMSEEEKERKRQRERQRYELAKHDMSEAEKERKRQRERQRYELNKQVMSEEEKVRKRQRERKRRNDFTECDLERERRRKRLSRDLSAEEEIQTSSVQSVTQSESEEGRQSEAEVLCQEEEHLSLVVMRTQSRQFMVADSHDDGNDERELLSHTSAYRMLPEGLQDQYSEPEIHAAVETEIDGTGVAARNVEGLMASSGMAGEFEVDTNAARNVDGLMEEQGSEVAVEPEADTNTARSVEGLMEEQGSEVAVEPEADTNTARNVEGLMEEQGSEVAVEPEADTNAARNVEGLMEEQGSEVAVEPEADTNAARNVEGFMEGQGSDIVVDTEIHTNTARVVEDAGHEQFATENDAQARQDQGDEAEDEIEDHNLIGRARVVGVKYEYAPAGNQESRGDYRRRHRRNRTRIVKEEQRLIEAIGDLPQPPPFGSTQQEEVAYQAIRSFEVEQMTYSFGLCDICKERRLQLKNSVCKRCKSDKHQPKMWSHENNMDPGHVPDVLNGLSDAEQMLIARIAPAIRVHLLKHGGIAAKGHCIAFPQAVQEPASILPRLPTEVEIIRVRRQGKDDTHKDFRVRRQKVESAILWLKDNNPAYSDITIDDVRIHRLPVDGELPDLRTVEFTETQHGDDQGPAPAQLDTGNVDNEDDETVSGILLPEPGVHVEAQIEAAVNRIVTEGRPAENNENINARPAQIPLIPWPTTDTTPASEFTTPFFFSMAFPCLFPTGEGDYHINRQRTCASLHEWAEHLLWYQDGRFAKHKVWKFVVHNMILRKRALEQSRYFVDQQLGDPHITVADLQERLARGDNTIANKLLYFGASLRGTSQYWHQRRRELQALVEFMVNEKRGLPSFFMTGSCAEFYFPPLRRLLEMYILETTGERVDLAEDSNARFKAVQENTHIVVAYFDMRTQSYHQRVLEPVFGISDFWYRYEFAKSRGQIHWHQLSWREDREPHQLLQNAREDGCNDDEYARRLSDWVEENLAMTASHPAGKDDNGDPRKELWPPPEGTAQPVSQNQDPLVIMLMDVAATQEAILEDHLQLVNRVALHCCSDYCLRTPRHSEPGLQPNERVCRMEFGSEFHRGKEARDVPEIVQDHNGADRLELPRDHPRLVQHSRFQLQSWRANGDLSLIVSNSPPNDPSANEIMAVLDYVCGYACKDNEPTGATIDLFKDMVNTTEDGDEVSGRSICAKLLMKTVGRRDVSGPEASFELSGLNLWRCSRTFRYLSLTGSRRLERNGNTATSNTPLDKYLARRRDDRCSWYEFASRDGKVPVVSGGSTYATWPLNEDFCRTMLLLHWPNWFTLEEIKSEDHSWRFHFEAFLLTNACPTFVKAKVFKARQLAEHPREELYEEGDSEDDAEDEEQPDWIAIYAGQHQRLQDDREFQFDDGGEGYDWSSTILPMPPNQDPTKWLQNRIEENNEESTRNEELELPDVCPLTLNEEQRSIVALVLHTLRTSMESPDDYQPLRLVVSGTGGTGKSYVIKCLQRLVRQVCGVNDAVQVITPTGNSAYLVEGSTAHRFLSIPTGGRSCHELTTPSGTVLAKIQKRCENLKVLIGDERSMFGRTTMGWMEQHARYGINNGRNSEEPWGGIPVVAMMGDDVQLPPVLDTPVYVAESRNPPSNHGRLVWTGFETAVELVQIVRQSEAELQLREVLTSMRDYTTTMEHVQWLQTFQWSHLLRTHGEELLQRMDEQGLFVFPTHRLEGERNRTKLLECNQREDHPVARVKAINHGTRHAPKADSNKAGGLLKVVYLCRDSKVMLVANLKAEWGLYNGAVGSVVDIVYLDGRRPTDDPPPQPDYVLVRFSGYKGPAFIATDPTVVPIVPISRATDCACCRRVQIPLRLAWGMTIHKCQGMTVGEGEPFRYVVIHPGDHAFEAKNPGALFVALSRAKSAGGDGRDPDFAFHQDVLVNMDRFRPVTTPTVQSRQREIERLRALTTQSRTRESTRRVFEEETFHELLDWADSLA